MVELLKKLWYNIKTIMARKVPTPFTITSITPDNCPTGSCPKEVIVTGTGFKSNMTSSYGTLSQVTPTRCLLNITVLTTGIYEIYFRLRNGQVTNSVYLTVISAEEPVPPGQPPTPPTNLIAEATDGQVSLTWNPSVGATYYKVKRGTVTGGPYTIINTAFTGSYTDSGLVNGTPYYYVVSAANADGESANSSQAVAIPTAPAPEVPATPTNLVAVVANTTSIRLTWTDNATVETLYEVQRKLSTDITWVLRGTAAANATTYTDSGLTQGLTYQYRVRAVNDVTPSDFSNTVSLLLPVPPPVIPVPAAPVFTSAVAGTQSASLSWTAPQYATSYKLKRSTTNGGPYTTILTTSTTSYVNTGLTASVTYYYVVSAVNDTGESSNSPQVSVVPLAIPTAPPTPTGLAATVASQIVNLTWTASSGALSYRVKRSTTNGSGYSTVASPTANSFQDTGLTNGVTYYYVVSAVNSVGESSNSTQVSTTPVASGTGNTIPVNAGGDLQGALNSAQRGDTIVIQAGATFTSPPGSPFFLNNTTVGTDYITIITSNTGGIPAEGTRVVPGTHASAMPKIVGNGAEAFRLMGGAHHYKLIGLEITTAGTSYVPDTMTIGGVGSGPGGYATLAEMLATTNVLVDRCFVHAPEVTSGSLIPASNYRHSGRGIHLAGCDLDVKNSWIGGYAGYYPLDDPNAGQSIDSYGIYYDGLLLGSIQDNNYIEAAFNNIIMGGADPPSSNTAIISNTTTTRATFSNTTNLAVNDLVAVYYSTPFTTSGGKGGCHWGTVKVTSISGSTVNFIGYGASGNLPGPPDNASIARWDGYMVEDVEVTNNTLAKLPQWVTQGFASQHKSFIEFKSGNNILIDKNLCISSGYHGNAFGITPRNQNGGAPWNTVSNLTISNNKITNAIGAPFIVSLEDNEATSTPGHHITIDNNLVETLTNDNYNYIFQFAGGHDIVVTHNSFLTDTVSNIAVSGTALTSPSVTFKDNIVGGSLYGWSCFVSPNTITTCWPSFTEDQNLIYATMAGASTAWAPNSIVVASIAAVKFVDYAGGNYRLAADSPGHGTATDNTDIGADIDALPT